ncbi:hypothetical protein BS636_00720 [Acinetobacter sp. LoGeW2-3]|uniref:hypothetical protein n=1 Tax=Acinetobacter sp. LoGeW2-3 TaxID=1808001 RepID=UPI000C0599F2|nr:hypothetical protein [Acinetobacter sp. LoGeW2-3]ATO18300.1 hypothetical protein BS636_00720 [Acinetobacter sp. LoGeW2-3]
MKKLNAIHKKRQIRTAELRLKRLRKLKYKQIQIKIERQRLLKFYNLLEVYTLFAPQVFNLSNREYRNKFLKFIEDLRSKCLKNKVLIEIDFTKTNEMQAEATLYFLAELDTLISLTANKIKLIFSKKDIVNQVLCQTGILKLLKINKKFDKNKFAASVKCWEYASGDNAEVTESAKGIVKDVGSLFGDSISYTRGLYKVITEAMVNSYHHAYQAERFLDKKIQSLKKWWLFSKEVDGVLTVCICDLGIGIPRSIKTVNQDVKKDWLNRLVTYVQELRKQYNEDSALIKAAIEIGETRTKLPNRGKGLSQIINELEKIPGSEVSVAILSNNGGYIKKQSGRVKDVLIPFDTSLNGTLITWQVRLNNSNVSEISPN